MALYPNSVLIGFQFDTEPSEGEAGMFEAEN